MKTKNLLKVHLACLNASICKDQTRVSLFNKVYHDGPTEKLVSSDGYRMTLLGKFYDASLKDIALDVIKFTSSTHFPNISAFDPSNTYSKQKSLTIPSIEKHHAVKTAKEIALYSDGTLSFIACEGKTLVAVMNPSFLKPLVGCEEVKVFYRKGHTLNSIQFCLDDRAYTSWYVVMPMKSDKF